MIMVILDFIEMNWSAFVQHCKDHGINEEEVEIEIKKLKDRIK